MFTTEKGTVITGLELRLLLVELLDKQQDTSIRFRYVGELWQQSFMRIALVSESRVLIYNENKNQVVVIDLYNVIQLEIDKSFQVYKPYFHYDVSI
jgi:hypothetical protein